MAPSGPSFQLLHMCVWACAHTSGWCHVCVSLWPLGIFHMATYRFICSTHLFIPTLCCTTARHFFPGGCNVEHVTPHAPLLSDILLPFYAWSSETFIKQRERNAQTKTTSLKSEILSYPFEQSGSAHHIYLGDANWFNLPCLHHA